MFLLWLSGARNMRITSCFESDREARSSRQCFVQCDATDVCLGRGAPGVGPPSRLPVRCLRLKQNRYGLPLGFKKRHNELSRMPDRSEGSPINIGALIFPHMDQHDFTGPFEVLSRIPNSRFHVLWKEKIPIRDVRGLILTPEWTLSETPDLDLLVVPGGHGQEALMEDEAVIDFVRMQAGHARYVFSVCTGALICGAAGLLRGVRATTHWSALHLLKYFGAIPVEARVVEHGKYISAAGVTAGLDGALRIVSLLCNERIAQRSEEH